MVRPTRYTKKSTRRYRKYNKKSKRVKRYRKSRKNAAIRSKTNARFIRKVVNKQLHPELKRYNALRYQDTLDGNKNFAHYDTCVYFKSNDLLVHNEDVSHDGEKRSFWKWYCMDLSPPRESWTSLRDQHLEGYADLEGNKMFLKYIHFKGFLKVIRHQEDLNNRIGHIRMKVLTPRGKMTYDALQTEINYKNIYDNIEANNSGDIDTSTDEKRNYNYIMLTRKAKTYSTMKIKTIKSWKWNRTIKRDSAMGQITEGSGAIVPVGDVNSDELFIPINFIYKVNRTIKYNTCGNSIMFNDRKPANFPIYYCFEIDCGATIEEANLMIGAQGVFSDM